MMDLTIRTIQGSCKFHSVPPRLTVDELKQTLHAAASSKRLTGLHIPTPENQNIVHNGRTLYDGSLEEAGIQSGDSVVIINIPSPSPPPERHILQAPSDAEISEAIRVYAVKHGLESKLTAPDKPRASRNAVDMTNRVSLGTERLQVIIDALEMSLDRNIHSNGGQNEESENAEAGENDIDVPEPDAEHLNYITEQMGISVEIARKALILHQNNIHAAVNWICEHQSDDNIAGAISESTLRSLYGRRSRRHRYSAEARPEHLAIMVEMGFNEEQARNALIRMGNNVNLAISLLTAGQDGEEAVPSAPPQTPESETQTQYDVTPQTGSDQPSRSETVAAAAEHRGAPNIELSSSRSWSDDNIESSHLSDEADGSDQLDELEADPEDQILIDPADFDQSALGSVSLEDVERVLGEDGDSVASRSLFPQLRRLLEEVDSSFLISASEELASDGGEPSAFREQLRQVIASFGLSRDTSDPYAPGPSGETQNDSE